MCHEIWWRKLKDLAWHDDTLLESAYKIWHGIDVKYNKISLHSSYLIYSVVRVARLCIALAS